MNRQMVGQYVPGDSLLHQLDARAKLIGFLFLIAAVILTDSAPGYLVTGTFVFLLAKLSRLPVSVVGSTASRMLPFFCVVFLLNALFFSAEDPLWQWGIVTLSVEGITQGVHILLRILLVMVLGSVLMLTTPPMELMQAVETMLSPLRLFGVPVEDVSMILSAAIQFIPTLLQETDVIRCAQTARGACFDRGKLLERAKALPPLIVPVFIAAFRRADELAMAMEARGYRSGAARTPKERTAMGLSGYGSIVLCGALCAAQIIFF